MVKPQNEGWPTAMVFRFLTAQGAEPSAFVSLIRSVNQNGEVPVLHDVPIGLLIHLLKNGCQLIVRPKP